MAKTEVTVSLDARLASAIKASAEALDKTESELIERALRSYYNLGNTIDRAHAELGDEGLSEEEADALALEAVKEYRAGKKAKRS
ncbi:MAG: ribbon-helix-helix protein, CopG family [Terriglobales bacterium]